MDIIGVILIGLIIVSVLAIISSLVGLDVVEHFRRLKHPKWYEHFDRAKKNSFAVGGRLKDATDIVNKCIATAQEAYRDGKWTAGEFRCIMKLYADEYVRAVDQYQQDTVALGIDEDLKAADNYAKEHKWKYGILYPDQALPTHDVNDFREHYLWE